MSKETGGQAFPSLHYQVIENGEEIGEYAQDSGITIRDYFANNAPLPTKEHLEFEHKLDMNKDPNNEKGLIRGSLEITCFLKYQYADAMIAERNKS